MSFESTSKWSELSQNSTDTKDEGPRFYESADIERIINHFQTPIESFRNVYVGKLDDGTRVAVKVFPSELWHSLHHFNQFKLMVEKFALLKHKNLLSIIGHCFEESNSALVMEHMPGGSLTKFMDNSSDWEHKPLTWEQRLQIALDVAQGLEYLHQSCNPPVTHGNIKMTNILLDKNLNAKLAEPGYTIFSHFEEHRDVYDFGAVLWFLITGLSPSGLKPSYLTDDDIMDRTWKLPSLSLDEYSSFCADVPHTLHEFSPEVCVCSVIMIAGACTFTHTLSRPSMNLIVNDLKLCLNMARTGLPQHASYQGKFNLHLDQTLIDRVDFMLFSYKELRVATKNFSASNKIGSGDFGTVYKGTLKNGRQVAVKMLSAESEQGTLEFFTKIKLIARVKHPNLVELVGCCVQGNICILVYEYLENNSLDRAVLGSHDRKLKLDWHQRSAICMAVARGLAFLHEELHPHDFIHRDIKASNIFLDKNLIPKIGGFGLAKLFFDNVTRVTTRAAGPVGYLARTKEADIYSFGVLVLEIISGKSSTKSTCTIGLQKFLLELAWQLYEEGKLLDLIDPEVLEKPYPEEEVQRYMKVALLCTQAAAERRPNITQVLAMLSKQSRLNEKLITPPGIIQAASKRRSNMTPVVDQLISEKQLVLPRHHPGYAGIRGVNGIRLSAQPFNRLPFYHSEK